MQAAIDSNLNTNARCLHNGVQKRPATCAVSPYTAPMMALSLPAPELCERARLARDARFDGLFYTAVRSTKIYCRPVCPAPPPKRENVVYYPTAAAATAAGFRPCLRCRPELSPRTQQYPGEDNMRRALDMLADGVLQWQPTSVLAARLGISVRQLQRQFLRQLGASPAQIHRSNRLLLAKQLLTETTLPVTHIALASGFNSLRRFNAAFRQDCGMPPTALRRHHIAPKTDGLSLRLGYRPPMDFAAMLAFLRRHAIPGLEQIDTHGYTRVIGPAANSTLIQVSSIPQRPELQLRISATDPRHIPDIVRRVRRMFDLDADLHAVHTTLCQEPLLARAISRHPGLRVPGGWDGFEVAVQAILGQQVDISHATTLSTRLVEHHGSQRHGMPDGLNRVFPTPEQLQNAPLETLGIPHIHAISIRALAHACHNGHLQFDPGQRLDDFIERCTILPGIGHRTAHYIAMRALAQPDAFPADDLIVQQVLGHSRRLPASATEQRSQAWRPWRSYAVLHLWHLAADCKEIPL